MSGADEMNKNECRVCQEFTLQCLVAVAVKATAPDAVLEGSFVDYTMLTRNDNRSRYWVLGSPSPDL